MSFCYDTLLSGSDGVSPQRLCRTKVRSMGSRASGCVALDKPLKVPVCLFARVKIIVTTFQVGCAWWLRNSGTALGTGLMHAVGIGKAGLVFLLSPWCAVQLWCHCYLPPSLPARNNSHLRAPARALLSQRY